MSECAQITPRLTSLVDAVGATHYLYDAADQLLSEGGLWDDDTVTCTYANRLRSSLSLAFTNSGLANGTLYYFVVSAGNTFGESTNSAQVSVRPTSFAFVAMNTANAAGQLQISWPADHTGWQLQSQTNNLTSGLGTNWINVTGADQTNQMAWPLNTTNGSVFFRLLRP